MSVSSLGRAPLFLRLFEKSPLACPIEFLLKRKITSSAILGATSQSDLPREFQPFFLLHFRLWLITGHHGGRWMPRVFLRSFDARSWLIPFLIGRRRVRFCFGSERARKLYENGNLLCRETISSLFHESLEFERIDAIALGGSERPISARVYLHFGRGDGQSDASIRIGNFVATIHGSCNKEGEDGNKSLCSSRVPHLYVSHEPAVKRVA